MPCCHEEPTKFKSALQIIGNCLDIHDICNIRLSCRDWKNAVDNSDLTTCLKSLNTHLIDYTSNLIPSALRDIRNEKDRVRLLRASLKETPRKIPHCGTPMNTLMIGARLVRQLRDTYNLLCNIQKGKSRMTINFDQMDFGIRRCMAEIDHMSRSHPVQCISDLEARSMWITEFGDQTAIIEWQDFAKMLLKSEGISLRSGIIKAFMCFPDDKECVTAYSLHLLSTMFGPMKDMCKNFMSSVIGEGFVGLVNVIHAEEMFLKHRESIKQPSYIIRYSRTIVGAFSTSHFDPLDGKVTHRRYENVNGKSMYGIKSALFFEGWLPARFGMDENFQHSSALKMSEMDSYCINSGYL